MSRYDYPRYYDVAKNNVSRMTAIALAAVAFAGCSQDEPRVTADGCVQKSAVIKPGETVEVTSSEGTTVALGNYFGEGKFNFSAAVIETADGVLLKEEPVEGLETTVSNLSTNERLTLSTLQTDTTAVDAFVKICPSSIAR